MKQAFQVSFLPSGLKGWYRIKKTCLFSSGNCTTPFLGLCLLLRLRYARRETDFSPKQICWFIYHKCICNFGLRKAQFCICTGGEKIYKFVKKSLYLCGLSTGNLSILVVMCCCWCLGSAISLVWQFRSIQHVDRCGSVFARTQPCFSNPVKLGLKMSLCLHGDII